MDFRSSHFAQAAVTTIVVILAVSSCVMNRLDAQPVSIQLTGPTDSASTAGREIEIEIIPGTQWSHRMQAGPFVFNVLPQFAIWTESSDGTFGTTLYVTGADFKKLRNAAKNEDGEKFFRTTLPVWSHRVTSVGGALPSKEAPYTDAITSATPSSQATINTYLPETDGEITLLLEINQPGDYNVTYPEELTDTVGQPSLVYSATFLPAGVDSVELTLLGHGGDPGETASIESDLTGVDTALDQVEQILVHLP